MLIIAETGGLYDTAADAFETGFGYGNWSGAAGVFGAGWGLSNITPFNQGRSFVTSAFFGGWLYKDFGSNQQDALCGFWVKNSGGPWFISFDDGGDNQINISFDGNNYISVNNGHGELGRWNDAYSFGQWNHFQIRVHISHDGVVRIRKNGGILKDGIVTDDFEACGDTQMTANAYTNRFRFSTQNNSATSYVKDVVCWDMTGPGPWNNWILNSFRSFDSTPIADVSTDWAQNFPSGIDETFGFPGNYTYANLLKDRIYFYPIPPATLGGELSDLTLEMNAGFTGNLLVGLYADGGWLDGLKGNGNAPGELIAAANVLVNPVTGTNTISWGSGGAPSVVTGRKYWFAMMADEDFSPRFQNGVAGNFEFFPRPYDGTLDDPADVHEAFINSGAFPPTLYATLTVTNAALVDEHVQDGFGTYVSSHTVGDVDMYAVEPLPEGMDDGLFLHVDFKIRAKKSDTGTRFLAPILKSGGTTIQEADLTLALAARYWAYKFENDPDTSVPWTRNAIEAIQIGEKMTG